MAPLNKEERDKLLDKIKKLFALATSPNEAEAMAAASKARELMAKYNLSMGELTEHEMNDLSEIVEEFAECEFEKRFPAWVGIVSHGLSILYRVEHYVGWSRTGHTTRTGYYKATKKFKMYFVGAKEDAAAAAYVLAYILRSCNSWAKDYYQNRATDEEKAQYRRRQIYKSYFVGLAYRVRERLEEEAAKFNRLEEANAACRALVVVKDKKLKDYMEEEHDDLHQMRRQRFHNTDAFYAGQADGDKIHLGNEGQKLQAPQGQLPDAQGKLGSK